MAVSVEVRGAAKVFATFGTSPRFAKASAYSPFWTAKSLKAVLSSEIASETLYPTGSTSARSVKYTLTVGFVMVVCGCESSGVVVVGKSEGSAMT